MVIKISKTKIRGLGISHRTPGLWSPVLSCRFLPSFGCDILNRRHLSSLHDTFYFPLSHPYVVLPTFPKMIFPSELQNSQLIYRQTHQRCLLAIRKGFSFWQSRDTIKSHSAQIPSQPLGLCFLQRFPATL